MTKELANEHKSSLACVICRAMPNSAQRISARQSRTFRPICPLDEFHGRAPAFLESPQLFAGMAM